MTARNYGQHSGVASALELVGERWALLIVRDLLVGPRRYTDLKAGLPRIPTNILSTRLKELQEGGVIRRAPLLRSIVYELTDVGRSLEDIILALGRWGLQSAGNPAGDDIVTADSLTMDLRSAFRADAARASPATTYVAHVGDVGLVLHVSAGGLIVAPWLDDGSPVDLEFAAGPDIRPLLSGDLSPENAIADGTVRILGGNPAVLTRFIATFSLGRQAVPF